MVIGVLTWIVLAIGLVFWLAGWGMPPELKAFP